MAKKKKDFVPKKQQEKVTFMKKFVEGFTPIANSFGFTPDEVTKITDLVNKCETDLNDKLAKQDASQASAEKYMISESEAESNVRNVSARLKTHPDYTNEIGDSLDIIGEEMEIDFDSMLPLLELSNPGGTVTIKWRKDYSEGVNIYSRRGDEESFSFLARDTSSPYHDTRPNLIAGKPETREYYAYYVYDDEQIGLRSATESLTIGV